MKYHYIVQFLLLPFIVQPQGKPIVNAIMQQCQTAELPEKCTEQLLEQQIVNLINDDLISDLPEKNRGYYFSISAFFMSDYAGKVIPDQIEVRSESSKLKSAIIEYVSNLPAFIPKATSIKERRSIHLVNCTFLANPDKHNYYIANNKEMAQQKILPNYITYDAAALYGSCGNAGNFTAQLECTADNVFKYLKKNYKKPSFDRDLYINLGMMILVDSDGKLHIESFLGSSPDAYEKEAKRVINTLPNLEPARINGIPAPVRFLINYRIR
ncbi:hypothetical protein Q765_03595 [Flavobacterium rivuli WB 3.3-2 = DSM 21788]|uniref:TonB C-terminal domain-containing protein n=1 Tax=Flavobacterium rivuli WB 3.3-2 = DSM 21788 TaxID=1121895 RepID=A0A0A2M796_9FLAO|nr:hypothetical protein [Flavobacterium rivuli]KGO88144.1 hypothetical protein Q765_03595 [Flavobacterium rivuli WB 3.3-2 = DSM 21788]